jgi:hypothetical protein
MTEYLIAARAAIILWASLAVMPAEIVFDAIEAELERRDVERQRPLPEDIHGASCLRLCERNCGGRLASFVARENNRGARK